VKSAEYHLKSFRVCLIREELGGVPALESALYANTVAGLIELGWDGQRIVDAFKGVMTDVYGIEP
jgi:hypothetical protein